MLRAAFIVPLVIYVTRILYRFFIWKRKTAHLPCYGPAGIFGYYYTAVRYTFHSVECMQDAISKYNGRPFIMPTLINGAILVAGPQYIDFLRKSDDSIFSQKAAIQEATQLDYTLDPHQLKNPYAIGILLGEVTREIDKYIPDIVDETVLALDAALPFAKTNQVSVPLFHSMTSMIARVVNRSFVGPELCRDQDYIRASIRYAQTFIMYGMVLKLFPGFMKSSVYALLAALFGGKEEPARHLLPHLANYIKQREEGKRSTTIVEALIAASGENAEQLTMRVIALDFGSIHTLLVSIVVTQTLFELAAMTPPDVELIRSEVEDVLSQEGSWTKSALSRCSRLDSLLREVGRLHGVTIFSHERRTVQDAAFPDGIAVPGDTMVSVINLAVHLDPNIYPDPQKFDAFRFYRMRTAGDQDVKYDLATIDSNNYLLFGLGRHACAGRFFAAAVLKLVIATILLKYDVTLPEGVGKRPKNKVFSGVIVPADRARVKFTKRDSVKLPSTSCSL
ncbi:putative cytochrome p450 [Lyophyllum shimeji]|uniref:Cytochrome p450 n=1 Tax=Lyophyllum shimeji TaxID=47721 RepID=A0A9P3PGY9_LYOSH|nr:putative cytochrome p450 [Lyophyllum shimeji]